MDSFEFKTIAIARTPFNEKFGIPRQSGLVDVPGVIELLEPYATAEAVNGLEQVSHIWLHFVFSGHLGREVSLSVRPPRLGGNRRVGVFATRSSYRPNPLGQSLVKLEGVRKGVRGIELHVSGMDLLDGTPILDIKPYLPYADSRPEAANLLAASAPERERLAVGWQKEAREQLYALRPVESKDIERWVTDIIGLDPRPAYKAGEVESGYGMRVFGLNIRWVMVTESRAEITAVES